MNNRKALVLSAVCACGCCWAAGVVNGRPAEEGTGHAVARHFDRGHVARVALPLGGIGCGSVSLSGRGELVDWEIMNIPNKGTNGDECQGDSRTFFAIRVKGSSHESTTMLAGALEPWEVLNAEGQPAPQAGLPRFAEATFDGAFPFGVAHLSDPDLPVLVDVKGFSPFVPGDSAASSLPVAALEYVVENLSAEPLDVSVGAFVRNFVGNDGRPVEWTWKGFTRSRGEKDNRTAYREDEGLRGIFMDSPGVPTNSPAWGSFALSTPDRDGRLSYRTSLDSPAWQRTILDFWDDFSGDGIFSEAHAGSPHGALALQKSVPPHGRVSFRFAFTWNFPNRQAWSKTVVGNWYSGNYRDGWNAAVKIVPRLAELERRSRAFTDDVLGDSAPDVLKEAALSNLAVLKSQTVFRLPTGELMGWEGSFDHCGSCEGSCTHVWNYENAVAELFPDLARSMREVEFLHATDPNTGAMDFRVRLPLGSPRTGRVAADGQMGCIMKVRRDWLCAKREKGFDADGWLRRLWPNVKAAMSFAWGEWDADRDGLMEGRQHNTMDVDYFGPNPQMGFWYLGALKSAAEMARAMGDEAFAADCRAVFAKGSAAIDRELFNGDYYEHRIAKGHMDDPYQLGPGCLVDQLVGQQLAHLTGLGYLSGRENQRKACESVWRWNWREDLSRHFNNMRVFAIGREQGLLMASWPRGRLRVPFPYFGEVMTGFEYVAAAEMIFEGMDEEALRAVKAVRDRHDGLRRNPFSEPECGHNYARSMASWNCLQAWRACHADKNKERNVAQD